VRIRPTGGPPVQRAGRTPTGELTNGSLEQLVRIGFDPELAASVGADRAMDLHALIELVVHEREMTAPSS
jgi:hypothetical protein